MITTPTTFIIGAGASHPYGLPTGPHLCTQARQLEPKSNIYQWILQCSIQPTDLNNSLDDLRNHPAPSIDGYLETRQKESETQKIGKHVIAALMGDAIRSVSLMANSAEQDWLGYVFARMLEGANDVKTYANGSQNVVFVTFNFDTIIESYFRRSLAHTYRDYSGIGVPRVIHVHGMLPSIPSEPLEPRGYSRIDPNWVKWLSESASGINIIIDEIGEETLGEAREAIARATRVCFLGFAYAAPNLKRLGLPDDLQKQPTKYIFGSAYGLEQGEQGSIRGRFPNGIQLGGINQDCRAVLRHFPIFD